eukprot:g10633.t1
MIVRVSDQHGHLAETAPRPFPRHKSLPSGDGTMANGATCRVWCEELQVPIFPDVDGVLFELLLVSTPRDPEDGRDGLESIDATGDDGSNSGRSPDLGGPCTAKAVNNRPKRNTSIGGSVTSPGESLVASCAGGGQTTESRSCTFVGAVALLLSEVVGAWREMESPLFDSAGGVAGTIKLAARMLGGETTKAQEAEKPAAQESYRSFDGAEALTPAAYHETKSKIMAAGLSVTEAVTSPPAPSGLAMTDINDVSPANRMAKPEGRRRERRGASPPTSVCYAQSNGSSRGSRCSAPVGPAQARSMFSCTEAALERRPFEPVRADDMAPTATIIYMGVKLPFRWFRSGTVKGIDQALREVLGINDASIASPVLYDVGTGDRMNLEPGTPSGSVTACGFFRYHDQVSGRSRPLSTSRTTPNRPLLRRSLSAGDMVRRSSQLVARRRGTTKKQAPSQAGRAHVSSGTGPAGSCRGFAEEVIKLQQQRYEQRKRDRLEVRRRQDKELAKAKAMACQLACRVLCRGHRTRVLAAALWRWRTQAAGLKMEQDRRDEQRREHEQATALLERLRQEVASLISSTYEGLVAVSIDALESDFQASSSSVTEEQSTDDLGTKSTPRDRFSDVRSTNEAIGVTGREGPNDDKENVGRAVAALKKDISRDDLKEGSAGAGADTDASASAGDDGRLVPSFLVPSLPLKTGAEGIGRDRSRGMETQQTAPGARWGTTRDQSGDDEVLGCFLARHAKEGFPPLGEGTWRQRGLENDAAPSELEAKVLWALFQVFSKCPPLPPYKLPTPSPATADGDAAKFTSASPDVHDRALRGRIDLPAFLETLADQELQIRDRQARETLALLDPSLQTALDANTELLRKVFAHYCHKPALQSGPKPRPHAHVHTSPRSKKASAIGTAKLGGGGGAARPTGLPALTMSFEGGKAFATDVGLVASAQELAEVWEVAWAHQRAVKIVREPSDKKQQAVQDAPVHSSAGSKFISFSGFLDFLGRCALRFGQTTVDGNRRPGCSGSTAALPVYSMTLDGALGSRNWRGEPVRTAALGKNGDCKTGGSDACGHNSLSGLSMLTLLRWIDASGVDGRRQAPAGS